MNITSVKITPMDVENKRVKASVTAVLGGCLVLKNLLLMTKADNSDEFQVIMPARKMPDGKYKEYFHPVTTEARKEITDKIVDAYKKIIDDPENSIVVYDGEEKPLDISSIRIFVIKDDPKVKGLATVVLDDCFALAQLRIMENPDNQQPWISVPSRKTTHTDESTGKPYYQQIYHPINKEFREVLHNKIVEQYNKISDKYGVKPI